MKNFILSLTASSLLMIFAGCTSYRVNADEIAFTTIHPKENHREIPYLENVNVPYEVLGTVVVNTERRNNLEEVIERMKNQIAVLGGDALTNIVQFDQPSPITRIRTSYKGTVIILKNKPQTPISDVNPQAIQAQNSDSGENLK